MHADRTDRTGAARRLAVRIPVPSVRGRTAGAALLVVASVALLVAGTGYDYEPLPPDDASSTRPAPGSSAGPAPRGNYIVVDRANNRLWLRNGETVLLDAACSAGSGTMLRDPHGKREWVFDTPAGRFEVRGRIRNPAWAKPDWAFVEEGRPVPSDPSERIEYGMLGEYALDLGDGYLIHGTLYERLLGRSVTHGCIRVGRDDLRVLWAKTRTGTPVYIF